MPSSKEYAQRLLEEANRTLSPLVRGLEADFQGLQTDVSETLSRLARKLDSLHNLELPTAGLVLAQIFEDISHQTDAEWSCVAEFSGKLRNCETQAEILNLLLDQASRFSPRLALFIARGDRMTGWSTRGFSEGTAQRLRSASLQPSESRVFREALETLRPAAVLQTAGENKLLELLQGEAPGPWHLYPMRALQRPIALLLSADGDGRQTNDAACSIVVEMTALQIENIALQILQELKSTAPVPPSTAAGTAVAPEQVLEPPPEETKAALLPSTEEVDQAPANPLPALNEMPTDSWADKFLGSIPLPSEEEEVAELVAPEVEVVPAKEIKVEGEAEIVAIHAEPIPIPMGAPGGGYERAPEVSQAETRRETLPESEAPAIPATKDDQRFAEEEKLHSDAKRFARLLVSEIKLYNEQRVSEGRENRDVYVRLKRDIDRSREMYEKRVAPSVSRKIDYFHDEVIRILGDNDPSTLGSDYPGPRVES